MSSPSFFRPFLVAAIAVSSLGAFGADAGALGDKSGYNLFNPTPGDEMRDLSTDRPDQTESPTTVDAGHFQIEFDFVKYTRDRDTADGGDVRITDLSIMPFNLKIGLLNHVDLQIVVDPYVSTRSEDLSTGTLHKVSGVGDVTTRLKINFWGNDGGATAFGIMPFVKWPLAASDVRNGQTEYGVIVPFAAEIPGGWGMGLMTEVDFVSDGEGGYHTEFINTVAFGHSITGHFSGYIEAIAVTGNAPGFEWIGQLAVGFTHAFGDDTQLDFGCNFGVTDAAPDYQPFMGFTRRY